MSPDCDSQVFLVCVHNVSSDQPYVILQAPVTSTAQDIVAQVTIYTVHYSIASVKTAMVLLCKPSWSFNVCLCAILYIAYKFLPLYIVYCVCVVLLCF